MPLLQIQGQDLLPLPLAVSLGFAVLSGWATYRFIPIAAPLFADKGRVGRDLLKAHRPPT